MVNKKITLWIVLELVVSTLLAASLYHMGTNIYINILIPVIYFIACMSLVFKLEEEEKWIKNKFSASDHQQQNLNN